ncbi:hypothetical protein [Brevibacterium aurantiacum]|uniref:hypothetical protein n=1 Tax=Brevibacterium aurantiacum TaxID=273384 RepID=UPI0019D2A894|nr:hypothetical protein [Brevibacterium aurantiacum]
MRIRSIKPEFWRSPDVSDLVIEDRLLFIGLWSYVDDNGVGQDRVSTICADLFADDLSRDPRETLARVSEGLQRLSEAGRIVRYTVEKRDYLAIDNWAKHQRIDKPNKPRYPSPTCDDAQIRETLVESSRDTRDIPAPGTEEQRNRGTGEQFSSSQVASDSRPDESAPEPRPDVDELLDLLDAEIEANGNKTPNRTKTNHDSIRLLIDRDGYTLDQIRYVISWCQQDNFWKANILSPKKLREKFPQLVARVKSEAERPTGRDQPRDPARERIDNNKAVIEQLRRIEEGLDENHDTTIQGELL